MRTVLIIMPQFSPSSYPPSQRVRLFSLHLEEFGWKPLVLTVEPGFLEEEPDWGFASLVPDSLEVIRTRALPARLTRLVGVGDLGIRSYMHHLQAARRICRERQVDLLFIPGPPWFSFLIGPRIKAEFGKPFVVDYIDPWVSSEGSGGRFWTKQWLYRRLAMLLEPGMLRLADRIVAVSAGANEDLAARYPFLEPQKCAGIPYGGEAADFEQVRRRPEVNPFFDAADPFFNIVYVGAMLPRGYDTLRALFSAVTELKKDRPDLQQRLRLHFIGTTYAANPACGLVEPVARDMGLCDMVREHPRRVPYMLANTVLVQADALLGLGTTETHYTASKIYPCILAGRPLLAIYHQASSVTSVLRETGAGEIVAYSNEHPVQEKKDDIARALRRIMDPGYIMTVPHPAALERYSARSMTKRLVRVFDEAASESTS